MVQRRYNGDRPVDWSDADDDDAAGASVLSMF
jgi:hypothetical protein